MQYRIYKDNVKIKETTSRQVEITGLKPKTTYTLGVSAYNGLRESTRATITMTTRSLVMIVDKALPVNSEVTLEYMEYPFGAVPLGTEPAGMFGGGNRKKLKARVIASSGDQSTLELLQAIEDVKTNLIIDADDPYKFNWVNAGSGGKFNITKDYAELTVTGLTQDRWIGFSMDIIPKTVNIGDSFTVSVPLYIDSSVPYDAGAVCIKEHASGKVAIAQTLPGGPKDKWFNLEFTKTAGVKLTDTTHSFYIFLSRNGSIKVGKPTLYYTNEQPSSFKDNAHLRQNLQIDGINLLQGTADFTWPNNIGDFNSPEKVIEDYDNKLKMLHISSNIAGGIYTRWAGAFPNGELKVGETYTFSFDARGKGSFYAVGNESGGKASTDPLVHTSVTTDWKRYSTTGTITELNKAFVIYFSSGYDVYIKCVKIERGATPTPWTPAREDIYDTNQIDNNYSAFDGHKAIYLQ